MNFLAHLLLSGEQVEVIMGNYVGDFVKGRLTEAKAINWHKDYLLGLKLHRFIDSYTDSHPTVRETKRAVAEVHGKMAGIALDIYFDYFLARYFDQFCNESLGNFANRMYSMFINHEELIPDDMKRMVRGMISQDWLRAYRTLDGIALTFNRLSRRTVYLGSISNAADELERNELFYHQQFNIFFPQLQAACADFLEKNKEI